MADKSAKTSNDSFPSKTSGQPSTSEEQMHKPEHKSQKKRPLRTLPKRQLSEELTAKPEVSATNTPGGLLSPKQKEQRCVLKRSLHPGPYQFLPIESSEEHASKMSEEPSTSEEQIYKPGGKSRNKKRPSYTQDVEPLPNHQQSEEVIAEPAVSATHTPEVPLFRKQEQHDVLKASCDSDCYQFLSIETAEEEASSKEATASYERRDSEDGKEEDVLQNLAQALEDIHNQIIFEQIDAITEGFLKQYFGEE